MSGFIVGFDGDPDDIAEKMTACIQEMGIPQAMIGLLTALPDTDLYERLAKEGRLRPVQACNNTHAFTMNFTPIRPEPDVVRDYKQVLKAAYPGNMKSYFQRCAALRKRWPKKPLRNGGRMELGWMLKVFGKYMATVLASEYRFSALRFLLTTLLVKPAFFADAVTLGVKGHHLWAITKQAFAAEEERVRLQQHIRDAAAYLQSRRAALEEMLREAVPGCSAFGDDVIAGASAWLRSSASIGELSVDFSTIRARAEELAADVESYRKHIHSEIEKGYTRLSAAARQALDEEVAHFSAELARLYNNLRMVTSIAQ